MADKRLRDLERRYAADPTSENWSLLTKARERYFKLDAMAMVNGFGFSIPTGIQTRAQLQPYIEFKLDDCDLIDIHEEGSVRSLPYDVC